MSITPKNELTETKIYVIKDPDTLEIRYVGKTVKKNLLSRLGEHIQDSKRNKNNHKVNWIRSIINKGKIPIIEEIDKCPWNESQGLETYYISHYKKLGCNLVNETEGGEGTLGRKDSKETIEKRKNSLRKKLPKVYQYDLNGNFIKEWNNAPEAAEALGFQSNGITRCIRGGRFKYKNFIWKDALVENASEALDKNKKERYIRNITKPSESYTQCLLGKIISQESKISISPYIYIYDSNNFSEENLLYEAVSQNDAGNYINEVLKRDNVDINSQITTRIKTGTPYYDMFYISNEPPKNYVNNKSKYFLIINDGTNTYFGIDDAVNKLGIKKVNIINNLKGITKTITVNDKKLKLNWTLNDEHCRLYVKTYGLSTGELEEQAKKELNIELTN